MPDFLHSLPAVARGIFYIIVFFGGSIFVHELGHFLAAKKRGLRVDRFSIGFGPKIFGFRGRSGTEYRLSLLPLGGYVSIPQLAEMELVEGKTETGERGSVPAKKLSYTDKLIVFAAGAFFNVLFAIACACVLWVAKTPTSEGFDETIVGYVEPTLEIRAGETAPSPAALAGIRPGDRIVEVDGAPVASFKDILLKIALGTGRSATDGSPLATLKIRRGNADEFLLETHPALVSYNPRSGDFVRTLGVAPFTPLVVSDRAGTLELPQGFSDGDRICGINLRDGAGTRPVFSLKHFSTLLARSGGNAVDIAVERGGVPAKKISIELTPREIPTTRELGKISFSENGILREIRLVPTPEDISDFSGTAPLDNLRVLAALPEESPAAELCSPGTKITALSASDTGIVPVASPQDLVRHFSDKPRDLTLFLEQPDGARSLLTLPGAICGVVPETRTFRAGLPLAFPQKYVRETPWKQIVDALDLTFSSIAGLLNPKSDIGIGHLNGIFSIAETYYDISFDLRRVLMLTRLININLAILNLLPIPVLDGGHILFATIERLRRKPLPRTLLSSVQTAFVFLLLAFMAVVLFQDFSRTRGNADLQTTQLLEQHRYFR